jgi:hypothetical protein
MTEPFGPLQGVNVVAGPGCRFKRRAGSYWL